MAKACRGIETAHAIEKAACRDVGTRRPGMRSGVPRLLRFLGYRNGVHGKGRRPRERRPLARSSYFPMSAPPP